MQSPFDLRLCLNLLLNEFQILRLTWLLVFVQLNRLPVKSSTNKIICSANLNGFLLGHRVDARDFILSSINIDSTFSSRDGLDIVCNSCSSYCLSRIGNGGQQLHANQASTCSSRSILCHSLYSNLTERRMYTQGQIRTCHHSLCSRQHNLGY